MSHDEISEALTIARMRVLIAKKIKDDVKYTQAMGTFTILLRLLKEGTQ